MNIDTGSDKLLCTVSDGVATITINRPEARNALGDEVSPAMRRMIRHAADDSSIAVLLITGVLIALDGNELALSIPRDQ